MGPVLVLVERGGAAVHRSTYALLTLARRLGEPAAVLCGSANPEPLGTFGAATVYTVSGPELVDHPVAARVEVLAELARRVAPAAILIAANRAGQEVAARLAARLDAGVVSDVIDVSMSADGPVALQSVMLDAYLVESAVVRGVPVMTVRTEEITVEPAPVEPTVRRVDITFPSSVRAVRRVHRPARPHLATAAVVVAGGRGLGSPGSFRLVDQLAEALGGAAGGSHTATELGWCPRDARVDQVGRVVHPQLYFGLGVSGSVRHRAAMQSAGTIVAIDQDPDAPIFGIADLGVVGDVHQVVPELLAEIERRRARPAIDIPEGQ
jgi:electron transfer flavoprotein alpha subunit